MFQFKRQATLANINLGNHSAPPSFGDMQFLMEQALKFRGRFVELSWTVPKTGLPFTLTAKVLPAQAPSWMLYSGSGANSQLIWGHNSSDLTLMHNLVLLECEKPANTGDSSGLANNTISAEAANRVLENNAATGSIQSHAAASIQQSAAAAAAQNQAAQAAQPGAAQSAGAYTGEPKSTWLSALQNRDFDLQATQPRAEAAAVAEPEAAAFVEARLDESSLPGGSSMLEGSLSNITVSNVLRYVSGNGLTGRLAVQGIIGAAEVFFTGGAIRHAATLDTKGDSAVFDVITCQDGEFKFFAGDETTQKTVTADISLLLRNGGNLLAQSKFIEAAGLTPVSYLLKQNSGLTRAQFDASLGGAVEIDASLLWRFYESIDNRSTLSEVLRLHPMVRSEWIPLLFTLLKKDLIKLSAEPVIAAGQMLIEPVPIDQVGVDVLLKAISNPDDGILRYAAFHFFLQQEFFRYERSGGKLAIMIFSLGCRGQLDETVHPLPCQHIGEAAKRINQTKRKLDMLFHFEGSDYAMLLPETDTAGAAVFANRICQILVKPPLAPDLDGESLVFSFGIASIPDDVRDPGTLLAAAKVSKGRAKMTGIPVVLYASLSE